MIVFTSNILKIFSELNYWRNKKIAFLTAQKNMAVAKI
jgi:hypothetical protein